MNRKIICREIICGMSFLYKEEEGIRDIVRYSGIGDEYKRKNKNREEVIYETDGSLEIKMNVTAQK